MHAQDSANTDSARTAPPPENGIAAPPLFDRPARLALACAVGVCVVQSLLFYGVRHDDAFITFRYAENLARGNGPVFNLGEHVLGTTAPGDMLLGSLLYALVGKQAFPSAMAVLGCVGWSAQALASFALLRAVVGSWAAALAAALVAAGAAGSAAVVALETNLVAACVLWSMAVAVRGRFVAAAALAALAGLLRPDAYLYALLLFVVIWRSPAALAGGRSRLRLARPVLGVFLGITLPWQLFALGYYGSPLPQPARVKHGNTPFVEYVVHELRNSVSTLVAGSGDGAWLLLAWLLVILGGVSLWRHGRGQGLLLAYGAGHFVAYAFLRPFTQHTWHLYPLRLVALLLAAVALSRGCARLQSRLPRAGGIALCVVVATASVGWFAQRTFRFAQRNGTEYWFGARDAAYSEAASFLRRHAHPGDTVGAVEVGTLGYDSELRMYDWGGLITPAPVSRPRDPELSWIVVDDLYLPLARGLMPVLRVKVHGFSLSVFSFAWMSQALYAAMQRFPGMGPAEVLAEHRDAVASALAARVAREEARAGGRRAPRRR